MWTEHQPLPVAISQSFLRSWLLSCYLTFLNREYSVHWIYSYTAGYFALNIQIPHSCLFAASLLAPGVHDPLPLPTPHWKESPVIWVPSASVLLPLVYYSLHHTVGKMVGFKLYKSYFSPVHIFCFSRSFTFQLSHTVSLQWILAFLYLGFPIFLY